MTMQWRNAGKGGLWLTGLAVLLLAVAAPLAGQQLTGNIFGQVEDEQQGRLPGVTVSLSGPTPAPNQTTDSRGEYRFLNLAPGSYTLSYDLDGFTKVTKSNVQAAVNVNTNTSATMRLSSVEAAVTVTGEAALLETRKVETGATVSQVELRSIPTARDPWVILQTVPGVLTDRVNVGGNESGQQSGYVGKGAASDQNVWNLDGVTITDVAALGSSGVYYDFDSFEEIQASTGGSDITAMTPGVQLNLVTKRGTNDLHGSARVFLSQQEWQSKNLSAEARVQGATGGNRIDEVQDYGIEVGGPIIRDRLWIWGAYGRNQIDLRTIAGTSDKTTLEDANGKLNIQILESTAASASYTYGDKIKLGRNTGVSRPAETGWNQSGFDGDAPALYKGELSQVFSSKLFATASYSYFGGGFQLVPQGGDVPVYRDAGFVWRNSYYVYQTNRPQHQAGTNGSFFFNTGSLGHELKFGFSYRTSPVQSYGSWPGNQTWGDLRTRPTRDRATLTRNAVVSGELEHFNGYIGDTLTAGNFTINAGLRYDLQRGNNLGSNVPANPVAPDILPAIQGIDGKTDFEWEDISPRVGVTYAVGAAKKMVLKGSYARYSDQLGISSIFFNNASQLSGANYFWNDLNGDRIVQRNELDFGTGIRFTYGFDPANPTAVVSPNSVDPDFAAGQTDEVVLGVDFEVLPEFVVGVDYTYREYDGDGWARYIGLTRADFQSLGSITNGDTGVTSYRFGAPDPYSVPVFGLRPTAEIPAGGILENRPDWKTTYNGVSLTFQKRLSNRWMARGNVGFQDWKQEGGNDSCVDPTNFIALNGLWPAGPIGGAGAGGCAGNDIQVDAAGAGSGAKSGVFINSAWQFNIGGLYELPLGFNIAANLFGREGYPFVRFHRYDPSDGLGERLVIIGDLDEVRHDDVYNFDMRLEKVISAAPLQVTLSADVFNVLNENTVLQRQGETTSANFNQILEIQSPRVVRLGARISF